MRSWGRSQQFPRLFAIVVVQISGLGPTDTRYFDPVNTPKGRGE